MLLYQSRRGQRRCALVSWARKGEKEKEKKKKKKKKKKRKEERKLGVRNPCRTLLLESKWNSKERITFSLLFKVSTYDISDLLEIFDIV